MFALSVWLVWTQFLSARVPRHARWRAINLAALRLFLRLAPSERQRVFVLTIVIGALCGLAAVAFHLAIQAAEGAWIDRAMAAPGTSWMPWTILVPTLGGLICGALLYYVVPDARGSGIPQVKVAYAIKGGRMPLRVAIGKFVIGVLQIGTGASLGREGPTVQICAGIASSLGRSPRSRARTCAGCCRSARRPASPPRSTRRSPR